MSFQTILRLSPNNIIEIPNNISLAPVIRKTGAKIKIFKMCTFLPQPAKIPFRFALVLIIRKICKSV